MRIFNSGDGAKCFRCGWEWVLRKCGRPLQCPRCKNPKWDEPKEDKLVEIIHGDVRKGSGGKNEEYDFGA